MTFYCENHTKHTSTFCEHNSEFFKVTARDTYLKHCALNSSDAVVILIRHQLSYTCSDIVHCILISQPQKVNPVALCASLHRIDSLNATLCCDYFTLINHDG
jgi:hypothetical protein